jgi:hypothetical protein
MKLHLLIAVSLALCPPLTLAQKLNAPKVSATTPQQASVAQGGPYIGDPTQNVLNMFESSIRRIDDLRQAESKRIDDIRQLEKELRILADKRIDDIILAEQRRVNEQATMRDVFYEKQRESEALRINAIRAVDVGAVSTANDRATQTASTLAAQVTQTADTARSLVASSATSIAAAQAAFAAQMNERIANLEKLQNLNQGQNAPAQVRENSAAIASLQKAQNESVGKGSGVDATVGYIIAAVGLLLTILMIVGFFLTRRAPVIQYVDRPLREPGPAPAAS